MRLIQFLALVAVFSFAWPYIRRAAEAPVFGRPVAVLIGLFAMLGRNSLYVFCVGSLLEPVGAGSPALLSRLDRQRHRRGTARHPHHGIHRMARRIATTRTARALVLGAALVGALTGLASGSSRPRRRHRRRRRADSSCRRPASPAPSALNGDPAAAQRRGGAREPARPAHPGDRRRARPHRPARRQLYGADRGACCRARSRSPASR